jgi:hypothetical protein
MPWQTNIDDFQVDHCFFLFLGSNEFKNVLLSRVGLSFFASLIALRNFWKDSDFTVIVLYSFLGKYLSLSGTYG